MMHIRRVLGVAAATATVVGLQLPTQAAFATGMPCAGTDNPTTQTHSLSADCVLTSTWTVEDGWKIDGNSHTITADPGLTGPVIASTPGASGAAPTSMGVTHVTIDAAGSGGIGILFAGAKGIVSDVRISGTTGPSGYGVEADNSVGATFGTGDQVKIDNATTISGYQRAAIFAQGNLKLTVLRAVLGKPQAVSGQDVYGVLAQDGVHGSVKETSISLTDTEPATSGSFSAGVRINGTRRVEVRRDVFHGSDADFGVSVENPTQVLHTTAVVDCNLFARNDSSASDPYGVAAARWNDGPKTKLLLTNSTFKGNWNRNSGTVTGTSVSAGEPNLHDGHCPPPAAKHVSALGGNHRTKVTWTRGTPALPYAPVTSYLVKAKATGHRPIRKTVSARSTSAVLKGLSNHHNYVVTVTAQSNGGQASATDQLYRTRMSLTAKPGTIHRGARSTLRGKLSTADPSVGKRKVAIWAKPQGGRWSKIDTVRTTSAGAFSKAVKPHKRTTYKAVYGGHPDLASSSQTTVSVH